MAEHACISLQPKAYREISSYFYNPPEISIVVPVI